MAPRLAGGIFLLLQYGLPTFFLALTFFQNEELCILYLGNIIDALMKIVQHLFRAQWRQRILLLRNL